MTAEERIFLKRELKSIKEYEEKTPMEICEEITPIVKSYKKEFVAKEVGCSLGTLNQYACAPSVEKTGRKPSYALYIKILNIKVGEHYNQKVKRKLSEAEKKAAKKEERAEYQHDYYESVTKPKRERKRQKRREREEREEKARKRKLRELEEEFED